MSAEHPVLSVRNLRTEFATREGTVVPVSDVSFDIDRGQIFSLVGESGSGKSVTAMSVMRLVRPPGRITGGSVTFDDTDLLALNQREMKRVRGSQISMIFQDPMTSLNPVLSVGDQIAEPLRAHTSMNKKQVSDAVVEALKDVGIPRARRRLEDRPHQFSGGMRQRVMIAMAMINRPKLLIADEPTTALDVTIQAQILDLLLEICQQSRTSILLITHDLGVVANISDKVAVMYAGQIHETGPTQEVMTQPRGPYLWGLLRSMPRLQGTDALDPIRGQPPLVTEALTGCRFAPRCAFRAEACNTDPPSHIVATGHEVRCHFAPDSEWVRQARAQAGLP